MRIFPKYLFDGLFYDRHKMSTGMRDPLLGVESGLGKDRKRFIVVAVFDLTLTVLLWLLCTVSKGDDWKTVFFQEIDIFDANFLKHSLFDVVLVAAIRMGILIGFYAICRVHTWYPVAISTALSSCYLIFKVLMFFSKESGGLPQYLLVISSFSVCWFELWWMPFRVLPKERSLERNHHTLEEGFEEGGRIPPIPNSTVIQVRANDRSLRTAIQSEAEFHSALDYSSGTDDETTTAVRRPHRKVVIEHKEECEKAVEKCIASTQALVTEARAGGWKRIRASSPMVRQSPQGIYYIMAVFSNQRPQLVFDAVWRSTKLWNDQCLEGRSVSTLDSTTEVYYSVSAPALRGYISSRDFVDVRRQVFNAAEDVFTGYYVHCDVPVIPPNTDKKLVRGFNGPAMLNVYRSEEGTVLEWIMQTDLKGGLPKRLVQNSMLSFFVRYVDRLEKYLNRTARNPGPGG